MNTEIIVKVKAILIPCHTTFLCGPDKNGEEIRQTEYRYNARIGDTYVHDNYYHPTEKQALKSIKQTINEYFLGE